MILEAIAAAWIAWALFNAALIALTERRALRSGYDVYVVGIWRPRICVSEQVKARLTEREYDAVVAHELGHIVHGHIWKNFLLAVALPCYRSKKLVVQQELQADAFAVQRGYAIELARALRKLSAHPFDMARADRLLRSVGVMPTTQAPGIGVQ